MEHLGRVILLGNQHLGSASTVEFRVKVLNPISDLFKANFSNAKGRGKREKAKEEGKEEREKEEAKDRRRSAAISFTLHQQLSLGPTDATYQD